MKNRVLRYDAAMVALYLVGVASFCFDTHFNTIRLIIGILFAGLFAMQIKEKGEEVKKNRFKSIVYAINFMIGFLCALKITEITRDIALPVDALNVLLTALCLNSICFIFMYIRSSMTR